MRFMKGLSPIFEELLSKLGIETKNFPSYCHASEKYDLIEEYRKLSINLEEDEINILSDWENSDFMLNLLKLAIFRVLKSCYLDDDKIDAVYWFCEASIDKFEEVIDKFMVQINKAFIPL